MHVDIASYGTFCGSCSSSTLLAQELETLRQAAREAELRANSSEAKVRSIMPGVREVIVSRCPHRVTMNICDLGLILFRLFMSASVYMCLLCVLITAKSGP